MSKLTTSSKGREVSLKRAEELGAYSKPYIEAKGQIAKGTDEASVQLYEQQKAKLLALLGGTEDDWNDWRWQMQHRIDDAQTLSEILTFTEQEKTEITALSQMYRFAITPYYLALIDPSDAKDPIRMCRR